MSRLLLVALTAALVLPLAVPAGAQEDAAPDARLVTRAVLPAETFAAGPPSGAQLGAEPINGVEVPFDDQPVQGVSALLRNRDGSYLAMSDNGFGSLTNSADYHLRVYTVRPRFLRGGGITVDGFTELSDPDGHVPFTITNAFTDERILTGADFDVESLQRAPDGTLWFGDEFGPFLLHTDAAGRVLEPPIPLPDPDGEGKIRSPQNPFNEEASAVRVMNALRQHAQVNGSDLIPVFSPWYVMQADGDPATVVPSRAAPPEGSGLEPASSEVFDVAQLQAAGYPVVPYTVNDPAEMLAQLELGVDGLISDAPDLLYDVVAGYDADGDGVAGDYLTPDGLIDPERFDAQGHRGARNLRPENTLPAMEVALDELMTTLETDNGVTADGVAVLDHDPVISAEKCRRADGAPYEAADEALVRDLTLAEIQSTFVCDRLLEGRSAQTSDRALSPVAVAFAETRGLLDPYVLPSTQQLFDFVEFYEAYHTDGPGAAQPDAGLRARNAARVRFNLETKRNPRAESVDRTVGPEQFVTAVAGVVADNGLQARADVQSFDLSTLLEVHGRFPDIRTVALFGDFPVFADPAVEGSDDGTNLQPDGGGTTPWLAGLPWPYRVTTLTAPFRAQGSGGFEGMALTPDGSTLRPMLERPLTGDDPRTLRVFTYDLAAGAYTGEQDAYVLDERGTNIGDFQLYGDDRGLVIERDGSQGDLEGFKVVYAVDLSGDTADKQPVADLLAIRDPLNVAGEGEPGDVGLEGRTFALPFTTIESLVVYGPRLIGIANDNNFPFSVGRHVGSGAPDDTELIILRLGARLPEGSSMRETRLPEGSSMRETRLPEGSSMRETRLP